MVRKFRLGEDVIMSAAVTTYPEEFQVYYWSDNIPVITEYSNCIGIAVKMRENENNEPEQINIYMNKAQAKGILKFLKKAIRQL